MTDDDQYIDVPDFFAGDYTIRYRGNPQHGLMPGDVLVIDGSADPKPGQLVLARRPDGLAFIAEFEQDMTALGIVTGLMRRING